MSRAIARQQISWGSMSRMVKTSSSDLDDSTSVSLPEVPATAVTTLRNYPRGSVVASPIKGDADRPYGGADFVRKEREGPVLSGPSHVRLSTPRGRRTVSRGAPVRWTGPDTKIRGAVSLLGFRRQLLVWLAREGWSFPGRRRIRLAQTASEAPSGSLAVRHLAGPMI